MASGYTKVYFAPEILDWIDMQATAFTIANRRGGRMGNNRSRFINHFFGRAMKADAEQGNGVAHNGRKFTPAVEASIQALIKAAKDLETATRA